MSSSSQTSYRPDIDGLRAVAVLAVVLFHFDINQLSGGYVGVDIFFVISGYLIGGIIMEESEQGRFTYTGFYVRRARRLLPAFFLMVIVVTAFSIWLFLPVDLRALGKSLIAASVYLTNIIFYRDVGYFASAAVTKPLLHTWSLAVEEQFYILFPLLVRWVLSYRLTAISAVMLVLGLVSLALAQWLLAIDPAASFYWLPTRAWELILGALLLTPVLRNRSVPAALVTPLTLLSVLAISLPIGLYDEGTRFPGLASLPPCLGTAWLLWIGNHNDFKLQPFEMLSVVKRVLSSPPMVFVGRISYSLYLWHWPIYVFVAYYFANRVPDWVTLVALPLLLLLGWVSWRYVEMPIRYGQKSVGALIGLTVSCSVCIGLVGWAMMQTDGLPKRFDPELRLVAAAASDFQQKGGRCAIAENSLLPRLAHCELGRLDRPGPPDFLLWGDSHGRAVRDGVDLLAHEHNRRGVLVWAGGCMPAFGLVKQETATGPASSRECAEQNLRVQQWLENPPPETRPKRILLVGRWAYYVEGHGTGVDAHNRILVRHEDQQPGDAATLDPTQAARVTHALIETLKWLRERGYEEIFIQEQIPEIPDFSGRRLFQELRNGSSNLASALDRFGTVERSEVEQRQLRINIALGQAEQAGMVSVLRTHDLFCNQINCVAWHGETQTHFDNNHITVATSRRLRSLYTPLMTH